MYQNINLIVVLIFSYLLFYKIKNSDYSSMIILTCITAFLICNKQLYEGLEIDEDGIDEDGIEDIKEGQEKDSKIFKNNPDFIKKLSNESINDGENDTIEHKEISNDFDIVKVDNLNRMGPYDGLCLASNNDTDNIDLVTNRDLQSFLGVQGPVQSVDTSNEALSGPTVDGDEKSPQRLFMLANNKASINCCETSNLSTSNGCICMTNKQKKFINTRGFNNQNNYDDL